MDKQELEIGGGRSRRQAWQLGWLGGISLVAALALFFLLLRFTWSLSRQAEHPAVWLIGIGGAHVALVALIYLGLENVTMALAWRYRMAFFISFSAGLALWLVAMGFSARWASPGWPAAVCAGSFLGGLLVTGMNMGLWENNSQPSDEVQAAVLHFHQDVIGPVKRTPIAKHMFDLGLGFVGLLAAAPVWLSSAFGIWLEDPGPLLFVKNSVGLGGKNFRQFKFRTMVRGAEEGTGPVLASQVDERVLVIGRFLRKTALDELPQLINILRGEMSFVGPRPQRTVLVYNYLQSMPEYAARHAVLPGLSGLAQVAGDYYLTPRQKLRYDRLYIRHAGLGFDLKLLILAFLIAFWYRWQGDWDGRLPRRWIRLGNRKPPAAQSG